MTIDICIKKILTSYMQKSRGENIYFQVFNLKPKLITSFKECYRAYLLMLKALQ